MASGAELILHDFQKDYDNVIKGSQDSFPLEHPPRTSFPSSAPHPLAPPTYTVGVLSTVLHHPPQLIVFKSCLQKNLLVEE
jgi:hypothetical protein